MFTLNFLQLTRFAGLLTSKAVTETAFFSGKIKASYFSAARFLSIWIYYLNLRVSVLQWVEIGGLLAAGIIMKQIAAMEVAHASYVLEQQ